MSVKRGDILHSYNLEDIGHGKFFVILNIVDDCVVGFFFINSIVNKHIEDKPGIMELQYILRPSEYRFLKHDSFVNGANLEEIPLSAIEEQLSNGTAALIDRLKMDDMKALMDVCRKSKLYTPRQKKRYFYRF